jgi:formate-dependent nitrite reductase membrane component NrfD
MRARPVPPQLADDGRHIDPRLGDRDGEAAAIEVREPDVAWPIAPEAHPAPDLPPSATYYDLPVVKSPPWNWYVPAYFYAGGLAGAAASLIGAAELADRRFPLGRQLRWIAVLGDAAGAALLVADLGRPARFHHMLRVFRPTSPMNLGTWILSSAGATSALGMWWALRDRKAPAAAGLASLVTGTALSTYTGVLLGNTAIPLWHQTRRRLPIWFAAISAASLGSLLELIAPDARAVRTYTTLAKTAQLLCAASVSRAARAAGVAGPVQRGRSSALWRTATWLGIASLAITAWPGGSRRRSLLAGALGTAAGLISRFAITEAGRASAADPRATFEPQRRANPAPGAPIKAGG